MNRRGFFARVFVGAVLWRQKAALERELRELLHAQTVAVVRLPMKSWAAIDSKADEIVADYTVLRRAGISQDVVLKAMADALDACPAARERIEQGVWS